MKQKLLFAMLMGMASASELPREREKKPEGKPVGWKNPTKRCKEESKARRKMAARSRRINRGK